MLFGAPTSAVAARFTLKIAARRTLRRARRWTPDMAFFPADRHRQSGIPKATLLENVSMTGAARFMRRGRMRHGAERTAVRNVLELFDVRPRRSRPPADDTKRRKPAEGAVGNGCKPVLLSCCSMNLPRASTSVRANRSSESSRRSPRRATASSSPQRNMRSLLNLCHRVLVFRHGRIVRNFDGDDLTETRIAEQCFVAWRDVLDWRWRR